jgi:hypothetical protein
MSDNHSNDFDVLNRFVETKRYMDFVSPGSQAQASFFGVEAALEGLEPGWVIFSDRNFLQLRVPAPYN